VFIEKVINIKGIDNFVCINSWGRHNPNPNVEVGQKGNNIYEVKAFYEILGCGNGAIFSDVCTNGGIQVINSGEKIKKHYFNTQIKSEDLWLHGGFYLIVYSNKILHHDLLTIRNTNEIFYHNIGRFLYFVVFLYGYLTKYISEAKKLQKICVELCIFLNCLHWSLPYILICIYVCFIHYYVLYMSFHFDDTVNVEVINFTFFDLLSCLVLGIIISCPARYFVVFVEFVSICQSDFRNAKKIIMCVTNKLYLNR